MLIFQVLGKMFQVVPEMSRSCMSYQGVSSFNSLGNLNSANLTQRRLAWPG